MHAWVAQHQGPLPHRARDAALLQPVGVVQQAHIGQPAQHLLMAPLVHPPLQQQDRAARPSEDKLVVMCSLLKGTLAT